MDSVSFIGAFGGGLLSFLSPCVLPLVPAYIASLCGAEVFDSKTRSRRFPMSFHALSFIGGFTVVFTVMGIGAGLSGFVINAHLDLARTIAGSLLILFGAVMLAALKIPWLNFEKRLSPSRSNATGYLRSFLTGAIFALAWTPCVGPILLSILTLAWSSGNAWHGASLLAVYSLGLGIPFLVVGIAFDYIVPLLKRISRYTAVIYIFSGSLLIILGILILTNKLNWLQM